MSTANEQIVDTISIENLKTVGAAGAGAQAQLGTIIAASMGMSVQNAVSAQQRREVIADAAMTSAVNLLLNIDPVEALSLVKGNTGNDVSSQLLSQLAALSSGQIASKVAGNTPPVTPNEVANAT